MRAVVIGEHGTPETLRVSDRPVPAAGPGEVMVRVKACALNHLDMWVRRGVPGHKFPLPIVPGSDVAGVIEEGTAGALGPGSEVVVAPFTTCGRCDACTSGNDVACREYRILGESRDGGCAEFVVVPAASVFQKPARLTFPEAASVLLAPLTAYHMVATRAAVRRGEEVLVTAAAGGVGTAAVQIAAGIGARVTGVVGSDEKREPVLALGAERVVVVPRGSGLAETVRSAPGKASFDVVVESVGGPFFEDCIRLMRPFGRLVTCGATAGPSVSLDLNRLFFRSLSVLGCTMGSLWEMERVLRMVEAGDLRPTVFAVLPLERIAEAHGIIEDRRVIGKVVVEL